VVNLTLQLVGEEVKGIVQRKVRWVESGVNQRLVL
jgi:hypothetical protein